MLLGWSVDNISKTQHHALDIISVILSGVWPLWSAYVVVHQGSDLKLLINLLTQHLLDDVVGKD